MSSINKGPKTRKHKQNKKNGVHGNKGSTDKNDSDEVWLCNDCNKNIGDDDKAITCSLCPTSFCLGCLTMSEDEYEALMSLTRPDVFWLCPQCTHRVKSLPDQDKLIQKEIDQQSKHIESLKTDMDTKFESLESKVNSIVDTIKQCNSESQTTIKKSFAEAV